VISPQEVTASVIRFLASLMGMALQGGLFVGRGSCLGWHRWDFAVHSSRLGRLRITANNCEQ